MDELRIQQLELRYRLPPGLESAGDRLDRVLGGAMDGLLEEALLRAGVPVSEEICLREVAAPPVRVQLESTDSALALAWTRAFADALKTAINRGGEGVVRYRTRHHALWDLVSRTAEGDLRRIWAWRQLGLWPEEPSRGAVPPADAFAVARQSAAILARHPRAAIGVLRELARRGQLPAWWARLSAGAMRELARAALLGAGADEADAARLLELSPPPARAAPGEAAARRAGGPWAEEASRALATSPLGQALVPAQELLEAVTSDARVRRTSSRVLAILALEDASPGFARSSLAGERLAAVEALALGPPPSAARPGEEPGGPAPGARQPLPAGPASQARRAGQEGASAPGEEGGPPAPEAGAAPGEARWAGAAAEPEPPAVTRRAGVLFLLNVLGPLGLHEALAGGPLAGRTRRWILHALALSLSGAEAEDPAALAFAGLSPTSVPPSRGARPPSAEEREALAAHAAAITRGLRERLEARARAAGERSGLCARGDGPLLDLLCRRHGVVVADPGWLEIRLDLDEVSLELRRAGLDLDPGWLPWLGAVVRFSYA